jgi:hypothetical protein
MSARRVLPLRFSRGIEGIFLSPKCAPASQLARPTSERHRERQRTVVKSKWKLNDNAGCGHAPVGEN